MGTPLLSARRSLTLAAIAVILEILLVMPFVDSAADGNSTVHFTQHGGIFLGGLLMGIALRDMYVMSQR
jgi:hypothetical protein